MRRSQVVVLTLPLAVACQSPVLAQDFSTESQNSQSPYSRTFKSYRNHYKEMFGQLVTRDPNGSLHVRAPLVNVDLTGQPGQRSVHVDSPFVQVGELARQPGSERGVKVDTPFVHVQRAVQGNNDLQVDTPFTRVRKHGSGTTDINVDAPLTNVQRHGGSSADININAPFAKIHRRANDRSEIGIDAPFTKIRKTGDGHRQVDVNAPFVELQKMGGPRSTLPNMGKPFVDNSNFRKGDALVQPANYSQVSRAVSSARQLAFEPVEAGEEILVQKRSFQAESLPPVGTARPSNLVHGEKKRDVLPGLMDY